MDWLASGVQAIEIFAARQHLDYANRKAHVKEIAEWFRGSGVPLNSVHSPLYADYEWGRAGAPPVNLASTDRAGLVEAMDEVKRALEIAEQIPFRFLVQHLGLPNESFSDKKFESAMTSIEHLRAFAKPLGVRILLENIPNELSTPDRLMEMIQTATSMMWGFASISGMRTSWDRYRRHLRSCESRCARRMFTTMPRFRIRICGRDKERSTGRRRWNCCAPRRKRRPCCWNSRKTRR
jgi:hypothetical protein